MRQNIVITGASQGLGAQMAREYAKLGYNLGICARNLEALNQLKDELLTLSSNIDVQVAQVDVCNREQVEAVFNGFKQHFGRLDRIIVNAGIGKGQPIGKQGLSANLQTANINFIGALIQLHFAAAIMREQGSGHIVAISSITAVRGFRGNMTVYAATKAALASLCEGLQLEFYHKPIKVSCIYPGYILTDINKDLEYAPFRISLEEGGKKLIKAIARQPKHAFVPGWPWNVVGGILMRFAPLWLLHKLN
ncbi:SDR family oxidoreductase [Paraferrimonas sp. SM1919]|uniref:SDR family oxidoreductase n=1 Tax=Paraferrimonas sp. SM1919 TaxID=2662263 RepID=UPI0013D08A39|nr:SDR family oxidoreductase [Paraferrimonas sp. SM1919]